MQPAALQSRTTRRRHEAHACDDAESDGRNVANIIRADLDGDQLAHVNGTVHRDTRPGGKGPRDRGPPLGGAHGAGEGLTACPW